jgi:hypothetical protein
MLTRDLEICVNSCDKRKKPYACVPTGGTTIDGFNAVLLPTVTGLDHVQLTIRVEATQRVCGCARRFLLFQSPDISIRRHGQYINSSACFLESFPLPLPSLSLKLRFPRDHILNPLNPTLDHEKTSYSTTPYLNMPANDASASTLHALKGPTYL